MSTDSVHNADPAREAAFTEWFEAMRTTLAMPMSEMGDTSRVACLELSAVITSVFHANGDRGKLISAFAKGRAAVGPLTAIVDRFECARDLLRYADNYDGTRSATPELCAEAVAHWLITGKLDLSGDWYYTWTDRDRTEPLTYLRETMDLYADGEREALFSRAARYLECERCQGSGTYARYGPNESGEEAVEERCDVCMGSGSRQ